MKRGFTIIETLVAITILMISIAGPLTIANQAITSAVTAKNQMIATGLAQEALEYINNIKDNNLVTGQTNWLHSINDFPSANGCDGAGSGTSKDICGVSPIELNFLGGASGGAAPIYSNGGLLDNFQPCYTTKSLISYFPQVASGVYSTDLFSGVLDNCRLSLDLLNGVGYTYEPQGYSNASPFTLYYYLTSAGDDAHQMLVTVVVSWQTGSVPDQITLQELLTSSER
jgi:prepilin-type N-terminal cleavage/methylation domain-containing protein